jgi:hypothetical protein
MRRSLPAHRSRIGGSPARDAGDVHAQVREAVERCGYSLFRIGLSLYEIPKP